MKYSPYSRPNPYSISCERPLKVLCVLALVAILRFEGFVLICKVVYIKTGNTICHFCFSSSNHQFHWLLLFPSKMGKIGFLRMQFTSFHVPAKFPHLFPSHHWWFDLVLKWKSSIHPLSSAIIPLLYRELFGNEKSSWKAPP